MEKHRMIKASVLLVTIFFHSFVLVPKANATAWEGVAGRLAFRAAAPSVIAALGSSTALVVGAVVAGGIGYLVYKSGAVTALKNWLDSYGNPSAEGTDNWMGPLINQGGTNYRYKIYWRTNDSKWVAERRDANGNYIGGPSYAYNTWLSAFQGVYGYAYTPPADPTVPTDYATPLATNQPSFPSNSVYATPGTAAAILAGAAIISSATMSDSDADRFIAGTGSTAVDSTGAQAGSPPSTTDNTVTAGDTASIGLLQQIVNYVSNLVGIKTAIDQTKTATDCVASGISTMTTAITAEGAKLDNIATISSSQSGKLDNIVSVGVQQKAALDNIAAMTQAQTTALENVETKIEHLDNTITGSTATMNTIQTRIDALRDAAATKFPFSLVSSISASAPSGTSHYEFGSLPLTPSISIPIEPMAGPLSTLFGWIRQLIVWFFWAGTLLAMLRKGMEM